MKRANQHDQTGAASDYTVIVETSDAPADVVAMAHYNRALLHAAAGDAAQATDDLDAVLATTTTPLRRVKSAARQKLDRMQHSHPTNAASRPHVAAAA
jgi:predicted dinucleotide-binding enzyme